MGDPVTIGHFAIVRELGRGGMGKVYLAHDTMLDRPVAIKVVNVSDAGSIGKQDALSDSLLREAKIAAALDHPGIVSIYQVGRIDNQPYIVMQYVDGPSLNHVLENKMLSPSEAARILTDVASALDYAHSHGVIHRDIKPSNIMLAHGHTVKLCDFGIAKSMLVSPKTSSFLMGTPDYMAPEQLTWKTVDARVDQWALSVIAYRLLTGTLPFHKNDFSEMANLIVNGTPPSVREIAPALPLAVSSVIARGLSKDPKDRFATCSEFTAELGESLKPNHASIAPTIPVTPPAPVVAPAAMPSPASVPASKKMFLWPLVIAALLASIYFAVASQSSHTATQPQPAQIHPSSHAVEPAAKQIPETKAPLPQDLTPPPSPAPQPPPASNKNVRHHQPVTPLDDSMDISAPTTHGKPKKSSTRPDAVTIFTPPQN